MSDYVAGTIAVLLPNVGGIVGGSFRRRNPIIQTWYDGLNFPSWKPPGGVFPVVWTSLYCTMGYSSYLVWRDGGGFGGKAALPLALYGAQLALNWSWAPVFFGFRSLKWGFFVNVCLWSVIAATTYTFRDVNETSAYLMLPYLGWVGFAAVYSYRLWKANPGK